MMDYFVFFDTDPAYACTRITPVETDVPKTATSLRKVRQEEIPADRTFRNAWAPDFSIDMEKARNVWRGRMRLAREPILKELDLEQLRGRDVEAKKQELRDVTSHPGIDAAATPEELKAVWPECLNA